MARNNTIECDCVHEFQDRRYGKFRRIYTQRVDGGKVCTVCGKIHGRSEDGKKKKG